MRIKIEKLVALLNANRRERLHRLYYYKLTISKKIPPTLLHYICHRNKFEGKITTDLYVRFSVYKNQITYN